MLIKVLKCSNIRLNRSNVSDLRRQYKRLVLGHTVLYYCKIYHLARNVMCNSIVHYREKKNDVFV